MGEQPNLFSCSAQPASKFTISADATYYKSGWLGAHELQTGVYLQNYDFSSIANYANGGDALNDGVLRQSVARLRHLPPPRHDRPSVVNLDVQAHD